MRVLKTSLATCAILAGAIVAIAQGPATSAQVREIQMTAKKYAFDPNTITVKKGEHVKLIITALDRDHGIKLEEFGIRMPES